MDRSSLKSTDKGFTLLELLIATALSAIVFLFASNLLINFGKFSSNLVKNEASLMGTALGAFEEIVGRVTVANKVAIKNVNPHMDVPDVDYPTDCSSVKEDCIQIRVDTGVGTPPVFSPSDFTNDTVYTYWVVGTQLKFRSKVGAAAASAESVIANDVDKLGYIKVANSVQLWLYTHTHAGNGASETDKTREDLVTTVIMRSGSAS